MSVYRNFLILLLTVCNQNINKQILNFDRRNTVQNKALIYRMHYHKNHLQKLFRNRYSMHIYSFWYPAFHRDACESWDPILKTRTTWKSRNALAFGLTLLTHFYFFCSPRHKIHFEQKVASSSGKIYENFANYLLKTKSKQVLYGFKMYIYRATKKVNSRDKIKGQSAATL